MRHTERETVAEIAARSLAAVRVLEKHGIDYCCGGSRAVADACAEKGIATEALLAELDDAQNAGPGGRDWWQAPARDLIRHIVANHHEYLRRELPLIAARLAKVIQAHGERDAAVLAPLPGLFHALWDELDLHMHKEETVLFPFVERYEAAAEQGIPRPRPPFGTVATPMRAMEDEHDSAGAALRKMREVTHNYHLPDHACATYRALFQSLEALEADLHMHIHLENNILFPKALALESGE